MTSLNKLDFHPFGAFFKTRIAGSCSHRITNQKFLLVLTVSNFSREFRDSKMTQEHRGEGAREENCRLLEVLPVMHTYLWGSSSCLLFIRRRRGRGRDIPQGQGILCSYANFLFPLPPPLLRATPHFNLADECARELHKHRIAVSILNLYRDARCLQCERVSSVFFQ